MLEARVSVKRGKVRSRTRTDVRKVQVGIVVKLVKGW